MTHRFDLRRHQRLILESAAHIVITSGSSVIALRRARLVRLTALLAVPLLGLLLAGGRAPASARAAVSVVPSPETGVRFGDSFANNKLTGWTVHDQGTITRPSRWAATTGKAKQTSGIYGGATTRSAIDKPGTMLVVGDPTWTDVDYSVKVSTPDNDGIGVVFHYRDAKNYYRFSMDHQRHFRRLVKVVDGTFTQLAETDDGGYSPGSSYRVRIRAVGDQLEVFLLKSASERRIMSVIDDPSPSGPAIGQVGLYTWASSSTTFDDVRVQAASDYFTIAVVPDTQFESSSNPPALTAQTKWLAANRGPERIALVLQEGDVVDNLRSTTQWDVARANYGYLDGKLPFVVAAGNHDSEIVNAARPHEKVPGAFNDFVDSFVDYPVDGAYVRGDYQNTFHLLEVGGIKMLVLNLEFGPRDELLAWAGRVADNHPLHHVLLLTHDYLGTDGTHRGSNPDTLEDPTLPHNHNPLWNDGAQVWDKFVRNHPNVQFTFNGHVIDTISPEQPWAVARTTSTNDAGRPVYQMLANYQTYQGGNRGHLRLLRVYPEDKRIDVRTYSPYQDSLNSADTYLDDSENQFTMRDVDLRTW